MPPGSAACLGHRCLWNFLLPSLTGLTKEPAALSFTLFLPQPPDSQDYRRATMSVLSPSSLFLGYQLQCPLFLSKFSRWSVAKGLLIVLLPNIYFAFPFVLFFFSGYYLIDLCSRVCFGFVVVCLFWRQGLNRYPWLA